MARVFLIEEPKRHFDISTAEAYGDITFLFTDSDRRSSVLNPAMYLNDIVTQLQLHKFDPSIDYFCLAGGQLHVAQGLLAVALHSGLSCIQLLLFNSSNELYEERIVNLAELASYTGVQDNGHSPAGSGSGSGA